MTHVPAWKRVGLKLKRPAEHSTSEQVSSEHISKKPKLKSLANGADVLVDRGKLNGVDSPLVQSVYRSKEVATGHSQGNLVPQHDERDSARSKLSVEPSTLPVIPTPTSSLSKSTLKKRKSVTFSPEAKATDGPRQELDYPEVAAEGTEDGIASPKKLKKKKKQATEAKMSTDQLLNTSPNIKDQKPPVDNPTKPYLTYLEQYYHHKDHWRFNKNRQTQVLQNMFNMYRIPESYDSMLQAYLGGLHGEARPRLRKEAQQILDKDASSNDSENAAALSNGVGAQHSNGPGQQQRARMVLIALQQDAPVQRSTISTISAPEAAEQTKLPVKRSRGRKRRTEVNLNDIIDTSSDSAGSGSSDSETSSDSSSSDTIDSSQSSGSESSVSESSSDSSDESTTESDDNSDSGGGFD